MEYRSMFLSKTKTKDFQENLTMKFIYKHSIQ